MSVAPSVVLLAGTLDPPRELRAAAGTPVGPGTRPVCPAGSPRQPGETRAGTVCAHWCFSD